MTKRENEPALPPVMATLLASIFFSLTRCSTHAIVSWTSTTPQDLSRRLRYSRPKPEDPP